MGYWKSHTFSPASPSPSFSFLRRPVFLSLTFLGFFFFPKHFLKTQKMKHATKTRTTTTMAPTAHMGTAKWKEVNSLISIHYMRNGRMLIIAERSGCLIPWCPVHVERSPPSNNNPNKTNEKICILIWSLNNTPCIEGFVKACWSYTSRFSRGFKSFTSWDYIKEKSTFTSQFTPII